MSFQNVESQTDYLMQHRSCISRHQVLTLQVGNKGARHDEEERRGGRHDCGGGQAGAECRGSEIWTSRIEHTTERETRGYVSSDEESVEHANTSRKARTLKVG